MNRSIEEPAETNICTCLKGSRVPDFCRAKDCLDSQEKPTTMAICSGGREGGNEQSGWWESLGVSLGGTGEGEKPLPRGQTDSGREGIKAVEPSHPGGADGHSRLIKETLGNQWPRGSCWLSFDRRRSPTSQTTPASPQSRPFTSLFFLSV